MKISNGARVNGGREPLEKPIYDRLNSKYAAHGAPFRPCNGQPKNQRSSIEWPPRQALDPNAFAKYLSSGRSRSNTQTKPRERERGENSEQQQRKRERERHLHGGFAISKGFQRCGATAATLFDYEP